MQLGSGWIDAGLVYATQEDIAPTAESNMQLEVLQAALRVCASVFAVLFGIACLYTAQIQPGVRSQWALHPIALSCLLGLFAIAACFPLGCRIILGQPRVCTHLAQLLRFLDDPGQLAFRLCGLIAQLGLHPRLRQSRLTLSTFPTPFVQAPLCLQPIMGFLP
jgi:hypothetical protein